MKRNTLILIPLALASALLLGSLKMGCTPPPQCNDGKDNDLDGYVDHPDDPGCSGPLARDEASQGFGCCRQFDPPACLHNYRSSSCIGGEFFPDTTCQDAGCVSCEPSDPHLQLTFENVAQYSPRFSPDGQQIVYRSTEDGGVHYDIWIMDADGANHLQLTTDDYMQDFPMFRPDGSKIVYSSKEDGNFLNYDIWIMDADGSNHVQLTTEDVDQLVPVYSPDGTRIVYASREDGNAYDDIWMIDCTGGGDPTQCDPLDDQIQLTTEDFDQAAPSYHPSGDKIVYHSLEDGGDYLDIWVMDADGSNHVQLTTEDFLQHRPSYDPYGGRIVYGSRDDGDMNINIWTMDADGGNRTQLTSEGGSEKDPQFSPGGDEIVYRSREDFGGYMDVWLIDCAGTETAPPAGSPYDAADVVSTSACGSFGTIVIDDLIQFEVGDYLSLEAEPDTCFVVIDDQWRSMTPVVDQCPSACADSGCGVAEFFYPTNPPAACAW
jgi:dipeptidyl aminopeptidase/acylaminoacyl peptidase